ncbi:MAG: high frequency lysogenization protein HflD [Gammaproteobacteria bacterium]
MIQTASNRVVALAAAFQAARLVQDIAQTGQVEPEAFQASLHSLFQTDAESVEAVFGGLAGVQLGLHQLQSQLEGGKERRDIQIAKYVVSLLHLERKLARREDLLAKIREGVEQAKRQALHFDTAHPNVLATLADTYLNTVSTLKPRILVNGEHIHLSNQDNANRIRTLLLAGIRALILWRQCGGKRGQLIFQQRALRRETARLLARIAA